MSVFQRAAVFCTLYLCQAYQQLLLNNENQNFTIISTHREVYMLKRLPYGVSSAPGILQNKMECLSSNISGTICFYDDIVVSSKDYCEVNNKLNCVLQNIMLPI